MIGSNIKTPGVYINEINAFPNSIQPVPTAVPAFIGYTPQATYQGHSYTNVPLKITSFADFQAVYCYPGQKPSPSPLKQYSPQYYLSPQNSASKGNCIQLGNTSYAICPDPSTIYYLYNSIQLFYMNGGGDAYIVSVGSYGEPSNKPALPRAQIVNPNVILADLLRGLEELKKEPEPTMYICPEATLLSVADNASLMQAMLQQCTEMQTAISVFDIIGGNDPDPNTYMDDISTFRNSTGNMGLNYGTAYYPFIETTITQGQDLDYTNLFGGDVSQLAQLLNPPSQLDSSVQAIIGNIQNPESGLTVSQNNSALLTASKTYSIIMQHILAQANLLPPSAGMAGVMATTDGETGVWQAPANTSIIGTVSLPIRLTDTQQASLNVDALSGKSVNAIRFFNGMGILVWGARTLDGNSPDWRYLPVRRTMIFIEQSCKQAASAYVFSPNTKNTWEAVKAMISSFLTEVWKQGGLQGATIADAFSVSCGLGSTMTADDVLSGLMRVTIMLAIVHPAEFMVITIEQQMAGS